MEDEQSLLAEKIRCEVDNYYELSQAPDEEEYYSSSEEYESSEDEERKQLTR